MAWFEFHQSLLTHRKTYTLAGLLKVSRPTAVGHLAFLWAWALDNAPDGDLSDVTLHVIKLAADWPKKPELFVDACVSAGFMEWRNDQLFIHDWDDYAGRLMYQRERNRKNAKAHRERVRSDDKPVTSPSTVPNSTQPTVPNSTTTTTEPPQPVVADGVDPEHLRRAVAAFDRQSPMGALPDVYQQFEDWLDDGVPVEWIELACSNAAEQGGRKPIAYIRPIIARYKTQGNTEDRRPKPSNSTGVTGNGAVNTGAGLNVKTMEQELADQKRAKEVARGA